MRLDQHLLLITPPMSQLNTPYPATAFLTGFLRGKGHRISQADLSLETALKLFSEAGLGEIFDAIEVSIAQGADYPDEVYGFIHRRAHYQRVIPGVILFLQGTDTTLAHRLTVQGALPEGPRFADLADLNQAFGDMGVSDKARHLCTLLLDDLADLLKGTIAPDFSLTRYAEHLAASQGSFDALDAALNGPRNCVDVHYLSVLKAQMLKHTPTVVGFSAPFPGNVFAALLGGAYIKSHFPGVKVLLGGGFANTELRDLKDPRVFDYVDYITLDDGERPILCLLAFLRGERPKDLLKRTLLRDDGDVLFIDGAPEGDIRHGNVGAPDYDGLPLSSYLSILEVLNPMHRLWGDGRWNKLTLAHGCYWKKCAFCDISLDYIKRYDPAPARELVDRMDRVFESTGTSGFHFVDEAAPPHLLKELAIELLRRGRFYSWWGNIRYEARFDRDLCRLLAASGAIAVSGGLEVASDRLLERMKKGVSVAQVAQVAHNFTESGVMVHAYLMYGFPTQTTQETIDSLERVRQLFEAGIIHSAFWHRFTATRHSPIGQRPSDFGASVDDSTLGHFANNDLVHQDSQGAEHSLFSEGLKLATFNYMNSQGFDMPVHEWFDTKVPRSEVAPTLIEGTLNAMGSSDHLRRDRRLLWLGSPPILGPLDDGERALSLLSPDGEGAFYLDAALAQWLHNTLLSSMAHNESLPRLSDCLAGLSPKRADRFMLSDEWAGVRSIGLLLI